MIPEFKPVFFNTVLAGHAFEIAIGSNRRFFVFFGSRHISRENLKQLYPQLNFVQLKQVHGSSIVEANKLSSEEADGHWTKEPNLGLTIATADCLPVLVINSKTDEISAIHAGWRGIENHIVLKYLAKFDVNDRKSVLVFIGPHIKSNAFEVGNDVLIQLKNSLKEFPQINKNACFLPHNDKNKHYVSLQEILYSQLEALGVSRSQIYSLDHDTYTNQLYSSFRRKDNPSGRQFSFITLL